MSSCARLAPISELPGIDLIHVTPRSEIQVITKCEFEELVEELGLQKETIEQLASARSYKHIQLRLWARKNAHKRYVPTYLLAAWGIETLESDMSWTLL